jgi:hypothetical protein
VVFPLPCSCGESCLLVLCCTGDRCDMVGGNENRGRSRRPGTEDRGWSSTGWVLGGRRVERSGDAVCSLHRAQGDEERMFLGLASKPKSMVYPGLASKSGASGFRFGLQKRQLRFGDLGLKITVTVSWFGSQNRVGYGLLVVPQYRWEDEDGIGHASRFNGLLCLEASRSRVFQSDW